VLEASIADAPLAFLATYASRLSAHGRIHTGYGGGMSSVG